MKKRGFTLVELLAVIAILAILVLFALPNILKMFNNAKRSTFETEIKEIARTAEKEWLKDSITSSGSKIYSKCSNGTCEKELNMNSSDDLNYYIHMNSNGKIDKIYVKDDSFQYYNEGEFDINDVHGIEDVSTLKPNEKIDIDDSEVKIGGEVIASEEYDNPAPPVAFESDSWNTIINAVRNNDLGLYNVGDTKSIELGTFGTHEVRIANKSTPAECSNNDFSQTACGFVLEFTDILSNHIINPLSSKIDGTVDGDGNKGGWEKSSMRQYVNSTIYNAFPTVLKRAMADTKVISSHGSVDTENYTTYDKLFLLSMKEVGFDVYFDSAKGNTRTIDYYSQNNNNASRIKKKNGTAAKWWLRTARSYSPRSVGLVIADGGTSTGSSNSDYSYGVSPAFKLK